ncbi:MAG: T9SS type A sorting domain-containing protein, partial [Chitinophagales bacterium]
PDGCFAENQSLNGRMDNLLIQSCTDQLTCNEPSLSINASTNFTLEVYPNPANTNLIINLPVAITIDELLLYSITGQQIHPSYTHTTANQLNIDLSNLSSGLYFLQVKSGEMRWGVEIVVGR